MSWTLAIGALTPGIWIWSVGVPGGTSTVDRDLRAADEGDQERAQLGRGGQRGGAEARQEEASRRQTDEQLALVMRRRDAP